MSFYVLLPGAGGDAWYWHLVEPRLRDLGHEVVAVDLPAADEAAGLREYADVARDAIGDRGDAIVVAQSMAGFSAPLLSGVRQFILVAPMIPAPGETAGEWWERTGQTEARRSYDVEQGRDPDAEFDVMATFFHDVPPEVAADAFSRGEPRQADRPFEEPWPLAAWPDVPTAVIAGRHDRLFPLPFMQRLALERLGIHADVIDSGHLPALSRPDELTHRLHRYRKPVQ
jgi:pimeloyl-ACP methyl ester carboxylesterase